MIYDTEIQIGSMRLGVEIDFFRSQYFFEDYDNPPEGGEIEINSVEVVWVAGNGYELGRNEFESWANWLDQIADQHIAGDADLFETLFDYADELGYL